MIHSRIDGNGQPLLIIHGFLGMSDNWKTLAHHYAQNGFQTHALDMRNHGKSFHSSTFSYEVMAEDIAVYCQANQLTNCAVIGHSMGGKVAMLLACTHPHLVTKLIVADIGPKYYPPHHQTILGALQAVDFTTNPTRQEVENQLSEFISDKGVVGFLMKSVYRKTPEQLAFRFNLPVFLADTDKIGEALPKEAQYHFPTLFIRGEKSDYIVPNDEITIQKQFPNCQFSTIPNAGHWLHADNPVAFMEQTLSFLG